MDLKNVDLKIKVFGKIKGNFFSVVNDFGLFKGHFFGFNLFFLA